MTSSVDLYVRGNSPLHRLDVRAKVIALTGFLIATILAPTRPIWPSVALFVMLGIGIAVAHLGLELVVKRLGGLTLVIGVPFLLSRFGSLPTQLAGEMFALKSLLVASAFLLLTSTTRAETVLDLAVRVPVVGGLGALAAFILRGMHVLIGEVMRTNRSWALRAPGASLKVKVSGLTSASISLLGRAAARSERVGAAMVLRGFDGALPVSVADPLPRHHLAAGFAIAIVSLLVGSISRWL